MLVSFEALAGPHVLRAGREKDVLALFAPFSLGSSVEGGWKLWSVSIEAKQIVVGLRESNGREERFTLVHPEDAPDVPEHSQSFALVRSSSRNPSSDKAVGVLFETMGKHDTGGFWEAPVQDQRKTSEPTNVAARTPTGPKAGIAISKFAIDGILGIGLIWTLGILLAARLLKEAPRWMRVALPAIVVLGIIVRLEFAPPALLGAWPWSRVWPNVRAVFEGPGLAALSTKYGQTFYLTDVMGWTNFAYAAAMPLVLFSHATYLLRDPRAGIAASFVLAFLPQHIRFSRCEDAFVPSLVLTSLAFALIHAWLRDPSKIVRALVLVAMPFVLYPGYLLRPLNMIFVGVYLAAITLLHPETAPMKRRIVGLVVAGGVGIAALPSFVTTNEAAVSNALGDMGWLGRTLMVMFTPHLFVLTDLNVTPLVLCVLALIGGVFAWRQGEKRLVLFLCGWLMLFITAHAFVVEPAMQPRYHMHLVVPFLLLGAAGVPHLWQKARPGLAAACLVLLTAPFLHRHWIRDLHYSEMQEYTFVRQARDIVPDGCTIIEYVGTDHRAMELRFARIGESVSSGGPHRRYDVVPAFAPGIAGETKQSVDEVLQKRPACLYVYEGLACSTDPAGDACAALRRKIPGPVVAQMEIPLALYDRRMAASAPRAGTLVPLTLRRIEVMPAREALRGPE